MKIQQVLFTIRPVPLRVFGWGTALQTVRLRVRFPMVSLEFFMDNLPAARWPLGWVSLWQKWVPGIFPGGWRRPVRRADNLTAFTCRLSWNLGASTPWNPHGLSRPVMGLLYFYLYQSLYVLCKILYAYIGAAEDSGLLRSEAVIRQVVRCVSRPLWGETDFSAQQSEINMGVKFKNWNMNRCDGCDMITI